MSVVSMSEQTVPLSLGNVGPHQRVRHAHIFNDAIVLHWHTEGKEPERFEGISVSRDDWNRIMDSVYWKREESFEAQLSETDNLVGADVHIGYAVFRYKKGKKAAEEEVSVLSLQQIDAPQRRRNR